MKTYRKTKTEKSPPKVKAVKGNGQVHPTPNRKHLLAAYEHIPVGIVEASLDGKYMDVNEEFCRILGYSRKELLQRGIKDCTHEDDYGLDFRLYEQLIAGKIPFYRLEKRFVQKNGGDIWVELTRSLVYDAKGEPLHTVGVVLDISDRKDVEKVLHESVERLRLATGAAQMFMWEWDFQTQSYTIADNFEKVLGFSAGLLPKNKFETIWALSPREDVQQISESFKKATENLSDLHALPYRVINPENGQTVWLEVSAKIVYDREGKPERMFGVAQNITKSKNVQDEISIISRVPEENPNPVMRITTDSNVLYANPASVSLLEDWTQGTKPNLPDELQIAITDAFHSDVKTEVEIEHRGSVFSFTLAPIAEGGYVNLYGKDITERKEAEIALQRSEANLRNFLENASVGIHWVDKDGVIIWANQAELEMLGYNREEYLGRRIAEFHVDEPVIEDILKKLSCGETLNGYEARLRHKDGSIRYGVINSNVLWEDGEFIHTRCFTRDITESKLAEVAIKKFARQQESLYKLSDQLHRTESLHDVFDVSLDAILNALQCDRASILLFDAANVMRFVAWRGLSETYRKATEGHSPWKPGAKDPQPVIVDDVRIAELSESLRTVILEEGIQSLAFIPLVSNGKLIGKFMVYFNAPHPFDEGELDLSLTIARQLTAGIDRKRAEEALARERETLERLFETMPVMVSMIDPESNSIRLNAEFEKRIGWKSEEVTVLSLLEALYPDPDYRQQVLQRMAEAGRNEWVEVQVQTRDGRTMDSIWSNISILEDQKLVMGITIGIDITERKQTEKRLALLAEISEMLRKVEDPYELMYSISEAVGEHLHVKRALFNEIDLEHDREIVHRDYHKGLESVAGIHKLSAYSSITSQEVAAGKTVVNVDSKTDPRTAQDYEKTYALSGERAYIVVPLMRENRWVASLWVSDDAPRQWSSEEVSLLETVAERTWAIIEKLRINTALRESEQRFREIFETAGVSVWVEDFTEVKRTVEELLAQGIQDLREYLSEEPEFVRRVVGMVRILDVNNETLQLFGARNKEDLLRSLNTIFTPEAEQLFVEEMIALAEGREMVRAETQVRTLDGRPLSVLFTVHFAPLAGDQSRVVVTLTDITERKRAEEALRESGRRFREMIDALPAAIYTTDAEGRLTHFNPAAVEFSGRTPELGTDKWCVTWKLYHPDGSPMPHDECPMAITLKEGRVLRGVEAIAERPDGRRIWFEPYPTPLRDSEGRVVGGINMLVDITERKRTEEALRATEALYRAIARNIPGGGVYVVDKDFRYLIAEGPVTEAFGLTREMLEGHTVSEAFPGERGERMEMRLLKNFAGETVDFETTYNGRVYWTQQAPLFDSIGQAIILTLDITERKQAEEALRQSEERFARFMQHLPGLAWIKDMDGRYVYANAAAEKAFNTSQDELYGRTDEDIFPPEVAAQFRRNDTQALNDEKGVQVIETLEQTDGILHYSLVSKFPIPGPDGTTTLIGGTAFDITERLMAEEALRESEERFRAILRQATAGIVRKDEKGKLLFVNEAFCNMLGYTEPDLIGKTVWEFMHPDDVAENKQSYERLMGQGIPFKLERRFLREDGSVIWVDASVSPIVDSTGKPQSAVAVEVDITGRKLAEEALHQLNLQLEDRVLSRTAKLRAVNQTLREEIAERQRMEEALRQSEALARANEQKLSTLFDLLPVGISFLDPEGRIIQMNPALTNIMKLSTEQLSDQTPQYRKYIRTNGALMTPTEFASRRALTEGKTIYNVETGVVLEDGEVIWTSVSAAPVDVAEVGAVVVTVDITESKRAERALQESRERLQILSQRLVEVQEEERRAIARELHDRVGQTLAALNINLIIISGQLGGKVDEQISSRLNDSMKLVAETIALVRDVMSNLRPSVLDDYGLEAAIDSHLTQYKSRYEISVRFEKPVQPIPRLGPSIEMTFLRIAQEALMNTAKHAQASQVTLSLQRQGNAICMTVQDNGTGIASWQEANRPGSHGLTIMRERAEAFGGNLKVSSVPGEGTRIEVMIPVEATDAFQVEKGQSQ